MSYRIIKNHQIDLEENSFEIPVVSMEGFQNPQMNPSSENKRKEEEVIKAQVHEILDNAKAQGRSIEEQAKKQAESIKGKAQEAGYQEGFTKGQEDGYKQGYDQGVEETKQMQAQAKEVLQSAHKESREYIEKSREEIIELAASMAKNMIHYTIDLRDENIIKMVKVALQKAEERKQIILRCPPPSLLLLETNLYQFKKICPNASFTFLEDKSIQGQGCIIETEEQVIHLEIDKQLENMVAALLEMRTADEY